MSQAGKDVTTLTTNITTLANNTTSIDNNTVYFNEMRYFRGVGMFPEHFSAEKNLQGIGDKEFKFLKIKEKN